MSICFKPLSVFQEKPSKIFISLKLLLILLQIVKVFKCSVLWKRNNLNITTTIFTIWETAGNTAVSSALNRRKYYALHFRLQFSKQLQMMEFQNLGTEKTTLIKRVSSWHHRCIVNFIIPLVSLIWLKLLLVTWLRKRLPLLMTHKIYSQSN